jgi:hypothetical protein
MKPQDVFGVVVRTFGLIALVASAFYCNSAVAGWLDSAESNTSPRQYAVTAILLFCAGLYLIRGAPRLVRFAYHKRRHPDDRV